MSQQTSQQAFVPLGDETRARLARCGAATLANALLKRGLRNAFLLGLHAVAPGQPTLIGPAWTLRFIPAREDKDSMALYERNDSLHRRAIEECPPGAVLVMSTGGDLSASCMGDMMALRLKVRGAAGVVTDGGYRDTPGIIATGLPCFQRAPSGPATPIALHPVEFNVPIGCAGVAIYPNDVIVGDGEGVVAIPRLLVDEIAAECGNISDYEAFVSMHIRRGRSIFGLFPATPESTQEYQRWVAAGRPALN
ncbi:ribonuclease activity regulator RraA [Rhodoferax sediminis]|jgi:regulator of RNase E activity RraA|uniref:Ribonuclease activity regulator RraA n=1 Tax=Rhodoferax sediminis TaxID=2509614 RepID=A0A515DAD9_9BURK|nr:ribonuclease activity regulator RraA [Rhodoferax sediminis]QDL37372.1 ribonuclease activity regulator RraA [Rhodoferax sediminis]